MRAQTEVYHASGDDLGRRARPRRSSGRWYAGAGLRATSAGAAIGDCLPTEPFPEACLESPALDVSGFPGPLSLGFFDIIASASPDMQSRVHVFDGEKQAWFPLIAVPGPVFFTEWTEHSEDLSPFKSKQLRVRFCQRSDGPSPPVGGWSIDDLSIGPPACAP